LVNSTPCCLLAGDQSLGGVSMAFFFGAIQGSFLDQYALTFITLAGPTETNHDSRKGTVFPRTPSQSSVASGQIGQMVEVGTREAQRVTIFNEQKVARRQLLSALGAFRTAQDIEHD
jgi:hypothetical protein